MNLKGFKKIADDEHKAILKNEKGHTITLAKKGLSKGHLDGLGKLPLHAAEGTDVPEEVVDKPVAEQSPMLPAAPTAQEPATMPMAPVQQVPVSPEQQTTEQPGQPSTVGATLTPEQKFSQAKAQTFAQHAEEYGKEAALWDQDLANGHITPKTYNDLFANKGIVGKVGTIFGLLVGGAGAGLTHQPNILLNMMKEEIDRDLEAQKQSKTNAQNYFKANLEHQRVKSQVGLQAAQTKQTDASTLLDVDTHAKNQMGLSLLHHLNTLNNRLPQEQRMQGQQIIDGVVKPALTNEIQQNNQKAAAQKTEAQFQQQNQEMRLAESLGVLPGGGGLAQASEQRHYPGIPGQASRPLTPADTSFIESAQDFNNQLKQFISWTKAHSGDLNIADRKTGETMAAALQGAYRQATNGGVYKEGEQNFISKLIDSNPTKFFNEIRVLPQLDVISKDNERRLNSRLKGLGFDGLPGHKETKWEDGIEYERGPDGNRVPVKK